MPFPALKLRDGFADTSPELRDDVRMLQRALVRAGHATDTDGLFGAGTEAALKAFQLAAGLDPDGVAGDRTWQALGPFLEAPPPPEPEEPPAPPGAPAAVLDGFRGDLSWVHAREGYAGKAYWPGGASGVTLDPGVDLGFAQPALVEPLYAGVLTPPQLAAVRSVYGIRGNAARAALAASPALGTIRVTRAESDRIFPFAAKPYWDAIVRRFTSLPAPDTLASVQTVMLSLS